MEFNITLLPGDGIGPEVVAEAVRVLDVVASKYNHGFQCRERLMGGCSIDAYGMSLTDETLADCQSADAVLLGAVGGPKWDDPNAKDRPERGLLALRRGLGLYANLRPVKPHHVAAAHSPLKPERLEGVDLLVVRELTGGIYFGQPRYREGNRVVDTLEYTDGKVWGTETDDLLVSSDTNFRPTDFKVGDDGALYVSDWSNPIIGHMQHNIRDPNRDHEHGRVYRITVAGRPLQDHVDIDGQPIEELLDVLKHPTDGVRLRARPPE